MKTILAAFGAAFVTLGVVALVAPSASLGNGQADQQLTYVTGQSANVGPSVSDYPPAQPAPIVNDDAEQHRRQLGR